jgi:hypothetical protein
MLHVYTRHLSRCYHLTDPHWRRCHCPKWIRGLLLNGDKIRRPAQTSNWDNAEKLARKLEAEVDPDCQKTEARRKFTLREAVQTFWAINRRADWAKSRRRNTGLFLNVSFSSGPTRAN